MANREAAPFLVNVTQDDLRRVSREQCFPIQILSGSEIFQAAILENGEKDVEGNASNGGE